MEESSDSLERRGVMVTHLAREVKSSNLSHATKNKILWAQMHKFKHGTKEYWKDWYWNKGGREKVQKRRTSEEGRLKEKLQRLKREGLKVV